ncbi:deoxyribonuclease V [Geobacter sp.]|uniref:deoxyribonuclease V n=1 Tax=Geobacter sp. TaxID=46610 RepID=UPI0027B9FDAC|nr:deoxyribonuclease V [Geobacter sp.]
MIPPFPWPATVTEAKPVQERLARQVRLVPLRGEPATVAGVDAAFTADGRIVAAVALFAFPSLALIETAHAVMTVDFPYVPGYLSFREAPALMAALGKLPRLPDLLIVDGQGIAHPRRLGIASFLGVILGVPAIGSAKSRLVGEYGEPAPERGAWSPLVDRGETVGAVLRTRSRVRPLFVSPGHLITLPEAIDLILRCAVRYRLPEPQRAADALAGEAKRELVLLQNPTPTPMPK